MADEGRVALYFLEPGEFPLPGKVTYDREYTPFRNILPEEFTGTPCSTPTCSSSPGSPRP